MKRFSLLIEPLDVLFFRDGRDNTSAGMGNGGLPLPQVLAGALRTALWSKMGIDFRKLNEFQKQNIDTIKAARQLLGVYQWAADFAIAGPWLHSREHGLLIPCPADIVSVDDESNKKIKRIRPIKNATEFHKDFPGWKPTINGIIPLWYKEDEEVKSAGGFLTRKGLAAYLNGDCPQESELLYASELFTWEERTGIAINPDSFSSEEGMLYGIKFLRLKKGISFYAEIEFSEEPPMETNIGQLITGIYSFGGENRRAAFSPSAPVDWPYPSCKGDGDLALLLTPGLFNGINRTCPTLPELATPICAAIPGSIPISGWDLAKQLPKPAKHAVVAGSVYFYKADVIKNNGIFSCDTEQENNLIGYNRTLKGVWKYE